MKKRIAALVLAASASIAMTNAQTEKVFADELDSIKAIPQSEKTLNISKSNKKAKVVNVSTNLRVRESASTSSKIVGNLKAGSVVNILETSGAWYKIEFNGTVGYSHSDFLQVVTSGGSNEVVTKKTGQVINVSTSLRIRSSASASSSIVGYLYANEKVDIISETGSWYKVQHKGKTGYVHKDYIKIVSGGSTTPDTSKPVEPEVTPQSKSGQVINVSTSLRIRSSTSTTSSIVGHLYPNQKVDIIGEAGSWYKIKHNSKTGYVHKDYVKVVDGGSTNPDTSKPVIPETPNVTPASGKGQVTNVSSNLRMRSNPSTSASIVGYLVSGDVFDITGTSGSWYKINHNGKVGFIHGDYVKKVDSNTGGNNGNGGQVSTKYEQVLNIMKAHVGTPYIYGGTGEEITTSSLNALKKRFPDHDSKGSYNIASEYVNSGYRAFDCSGLMQWSFKQVGINLERTTYDQVKAGYEVSASAAKPGDLLFFSNLGHVGMYMGNGKWIESPKPGQTVRIADVPWNLIGRARRVL